MVYCATFGCKNLRICPKNYHYWNTTIYSLTYLRVQKMIYVLHILRAIKNKLKNSLYVFCYQSADQSEGLEFVGEQ